MRWFSLSHITHSGHR